MSDYQIKMPISRQEIPSPRLGTLFDDVYKQVEQLENCQWLPVTFSSIEEAEKLRLAATRRDYNATRRDTTTYVSKKALS